MMANQIDLSVHPVALVSVEKDFATYTLQNSIGTKLLSSNQKLLGVLCVLIINATKTTQAT